MDSRVEAFFQSVKGKRVTFCGIGGSNLPLIALFQEKGAVVSARDRRTREALGKTGDSLEARGVTLHLGETYLQNLDEDVIFRTPGMKFTLPELEAARARGAAVTSEMEIFFDLCPCIIYAVTGSDGKTTTTTIISEFLKAAGKIVHLGGNIGRPLLPEIERVAADDVAVVELSSFQLISMRKSPDVAVVTNLSPNHLDYHRSMGEYIAAKENIFLHQGEEDRAIFNYDNQLTRDLAEKAGGAVTFFSRRERLEEGVYLRDGAIWLTNDQGSREVLPLELIQLPGDHNVENYMAAICAVEGLASDDDIRAVARTFGGVEHRIELVRVKDGVSYYNDSIASSPSRTIAGLNAFEKPVILIAGGYDKHIPYAPLGPVAAKTVKAAILMGATADAIEAAIRAHADLPIYRVYNMEEAVQKAAAIAGQGDIVFMSPASASFDMYPNFEVRGNHFKDLVQALPAV